MGSGASKSGTEARTVAQAVVRFRHQTSGSRNRERTAQASGSNTNSNASTPSPTTNKPRAGKPAESVVNQKTTKPKEQGKRKTSTTSNKQIPAKPKGKNNGEQTAKQKTTTNSKTESQKNVPKPGSNSPCTTIAESTPLDMQVEQVFQGAMTLKCPVNTRIIRIFTSSTFTDTEHERNALMENVYPKLKSFCQQQGFEFQVVDMRWGVRDESTNMHETIDLCIKEIRACQELSVGPNFVTFLSEKYGHCPLLPSIEATEFEKLLEVITDEDVLKLLERWYWRDENSIPISYVLQPVTKWIHNYLNEHSDHLQQEARKQWKDEHTRMRCSLAGAARIALQSSELQHKFVKSVCEHELETGLISAPLPHKKCVWFRRHINFMDSELEENDHAAKYLDKTDSSDGNQTSAQELLQGLKDHLVKILPSDNVMDYTVDWTPSGLDPNVDHHKTYLDKLCYDFEHILKTMIRQSITEHMTGKINNPLYEEVVQHTLFAQNKIDMFHGRNETLKVIESYVKGKSNQPLVVHGVSGSGKTSVIAMAAKNIKEWLSGKANTVVRFIGTTPRSSTIRRLLITVIEQIKHIYNLKKKFRRDMKSLTEQFPEFLAAASGDHPLVVMFDSLDQLNTQQARQLAWLPRKLPEHVKLLVSTLSDPRYKCLPKLQAVLKDSRCFVSLPELPRDDASSILKKWLQQHRRTLQSAQFDAILAAFSKCSLPLFLKISFNEACKWKSYTPSCDTVLADTIREAIALLFERVERQHGETRVRHALGYITAAKSGLTASELEDILSCDDEVLSDVFQYWTPPIRRLPPLLWVRIHTELSSFLVDRGANEARVTCWHHRQFEEAAQDRYLSDVTQKKKFHSAIADYFLCKYQKEERSGTSTVLRGKFMRSVSVLDQPLKLTGNQYNLRKLHELPYHLICSERWEELKSEVLCNFQWLSAKIKGRSLRACIDDFYLAMKSLPNVDPDISAVGETLRISEDAILIDNNALASQLVARLYEHKVEGTASLVKANLSKVLENLLFEARDPPDPCLIPSRAFLTPPGGQLVETLVGHKAGVYALAVTENGRYIVTGSKDGRVKVWDSDEGSLFQTIEELGGDIGAVRCCYNDRLIVVSSTRGLTVLSFETGEVLHSLCLKFFNFAPPIVCAGKDGTLVAVFTETDMQVYSALSGRVLHVFHQTKPVGDVGQNSLLAAFENVVACNSKENENTLHVFDIDRFKEERSFDIFEQEDDEQFLHVTQVIMKSEDEVLVAKKMKIDIYSVEHGYILRSLKGKLDDWIQHMHISNDGTVLVFPKRNMVVLMDLLTGERKDILPHANYVSRVLAVNSNVILTSGSDNMVCIWDLTREDVNKRVGKLETVLSIHCIPNNSRHLITVGRIGIDNHCVTVWDLSTVLPIRKVSGIKSNYIQIINDRRAALRVENRIAIVDLNTWKVVNVLKGTIPDFVFASLVDFFPISEGKEILTFSSTHRDLSIYNIETGEEVATLKSRRPNEVINAFMADDRGTVVVYNDDPLDTAFFWDLETRDFLFEVKRKGKYKSLTLTHASFTPNGKYFVVSMRKTDETDYIRHPCVWNIQEKKLYHDLRYSNDVDCTSLTILDNSRCMTAHKDMNVVMWDIIHGTVIRQLSTPHHGNRIDVVSSQDVFALSYDEKNLVLWDTRDGKKKACFTADKVSAVRLLGDGSCVALASDSVMPLVLLKLKGKGLGSTSSYGTTSQGSRAMAGTDVDIVFEGIDDKYLEDENLFIDTIMS